ncbi:MAG: hypothetical protein COV74_04300 [Candidatus Omnitrophica bacterium CG11_big_fil_rev_8_21_14_0_20_45_26]|uniref:Zinc finger DksA/TraR C4-type domain-containing protein n=1 Tax=Candidatus Abzuiibacterium crystallinum TaxID=1974748 RepID=A0A2H0LSY0_9BACT|nr:MAG: hypothetical protein COV74_04300 [Candidatus Omnitrophica bacterium CG11_big_fil_rev_8_21_14_0_20_45_26]PIW63967.1 MAG: hypothetical protein COW12_08680 [Candidatus Omnitrophica bacterium CG12_big_fil_rev_8_21_14_0_65_45_16]
MPRPKKTKQRFSAKDLEYYKGLLLTLRERIRTGLQHIEEDSLNKSQKDGSGDLSGYSFHMADMATDSFDTEFRLGIASSEQDLLYEIDHALKKIEDGTYGLCEKYEIPISKARLKAMPFARYSLKAQQEEEKNNPGSRG